MRTSIVLLVLIFSSVMVMAHTLTLKVKGIEKKEGSIYVGIYDSKDSFMKKVTFGFMAPVKDDVVTITCPDIPAGTYAVSLFQDLNGNGKVDYGDMGRPTEKFGFSNDAEVVMGPPSFKKCSFELKKDTTMVINLQ